MNKLSEIISEILIIPVDKINPEDSLDSLDNWDSLNHLRIVAEIEERFKTTIPMEDISAIKKVKDFLKYL